MGFGVVASPAGGPAESGRAGSAGAGKTGKAPLYFIRIIDRVAR